MSLFQHILVPVDFGEPSEHAVDLAVEMAIRCDAKLTLFHAGPTPASYYAAYGEGITFPDGELQTRANAMLAAALARAQTRYPRADSAVTIGTPWEEILGAVKARAADLVVMGTHGRRGVAHVFLGSVAEKVVRHATVPVLTTRGRPVEKAPRT